MISYQNANMHECRDSSVPADNSAMAQSAGDHERDRPYLRIYFECANEYVRVYRRPDQQHYLARCPKCSMTKRFTVGPGGTDNRFFQLTCQ